MIPPAMPTEHHQGLLEYTRPDCGADDVMDSHQCDVINYIGLGVKTLYFT